MRVHDLSSLEPGVSIIGGRSNFLLGSILRKAWLGQVLTVPPSLGFMCLKSATGLVTPLTALIKDSVGLLLLKGKVTWELGARH